jgi:parallel beta-helix repeat protein
VKYYGPYFDMPLEHHDISTIPSDQDFSDEGRASVNIGSNTVIGNQGGIVIYDCGDVFIDNNIVVDNEGSRGGIYMYDAEGTIIISNNEIADNDRAIGCLLSPSLTIRSNLITGNTGIDLVGGILCSEMSEVIVDSNDICGNAGYGILNSVPTCTIEAEYNWWGSATGPYHPDLNPAGLGDTVSDYVDFEPWAYSRFGIQEEPNLIYRNRFNLQIHPNPFIGRTEIRYSLRSPGHVNLKVYNLLGQEISTLVDGRQIAGEHTIEWQPTNIPVGIYFIRLETKKNIETRRCLLLR